MPIPARMHKKGISPYNAIITYRRTLHFTFALLRVGIQARTQK
jgi:hypothetical protein